MPDLSILPDKPTPERLLGVGVAKPTLPAAPEMREFGDALATRRNIYTDTLKAAQEIAPLSDERYTLSLRDVDWADPERFTRKQRKQAVLTGETLARRLRGTWELSDNATGQVIQRRQQVVARVPYLSSLGTFTHRGTDYAVINQQRLLPGVFTRVMDNGHIESHVNTLPGKGLSHRYFLDPEKGVFKIRLQQAEMPLMPLLQMLGVTDKELRDAWGPDLVATNMHHNDAGVIKKLAARLLRRQDQGGDERTTRERLIEAVTHMELDPEVNRRTLGQPYARLDKDAILATTRKLLAVSRGEADPDDRDHPAFQAFFGPEDLFAERIRRDAGRLRAGLFRKISQAGNLDKMPAGALTPQLEQVLLGSGLGQPLEEVNAMELLDKQGRVTRMGVGGIPSLLSVPDEARGVMAGHLGFIDLTKTPESETAGIDLSMARASRKGRDGKVYTQVRDQQGKLDWKTPQDLIDANVATPDVMRWDTKRVPVIRGNKVVYVPKTQVDYVLPHFEDSFSPLSNLVPLKSMIKGQRTSMAARMITQALPLVQPEAPLVRSAVPGSGGLRSFEEEYGRHAGAVTAAQDGHVIDVKDGTLTLRYANGKTEDIELYETMPMNRKTMFHQTPLVAPGQMFKKGQPLVRSNYTDDTGAVALGANARVAFVPWRGSNFEDAITISESFAKRFTSEHAYQQQLEVTDRHKVGKRAYVGLFPARFDRQTLSKLDDQGVVQPGTEVNYGEPLILAAKEKDRAQNKIHKRRQPGYSDETVIWKHHDPGIVTDVVWGKSGPTVLIKSTSTMQVGDKMAGRAGNKGVVGAILRDDQMPVLADGKPAEVLMNPLGTISRTNPGALVEAVLGKVAAKTGKPVYVPDFDDDKDMTAWAQQQLRQHGVSDLEDVIDPTTGRKVRGVLTGNQFFMKLHHMAESKGQGRGSGGYASDEQPSKGGETGCFVGDTEITTVDLGCQPTRRTLRQVYAQRYDGLTATVRTPAHGSGWRPITDWFHYRVAPTELVVLTLANGQQITCTRNHEFVLANGQRRLAGALRPGDDLLEIADGSVLAVSDESRELAPQVGG